MGRGRVQCLPFGLARVGGEFGVQGPGLGRTGGREFVAPVGDGERLAAAPGGAHPWREGLGVVRLVSAQWLLIH